MCLARACRLPTMAARDKQPQQQKGDGTVPTVPSLKTLRSPTVLHSALASFLPLSRVCRELGSILWLNNNQQ